ncbi:MAG: hypothetical protein JOY71_16690, partial [Acetobacteraceae bacterium]|nr:hypothetical protein [Acetobacteraceae bacterium]
ALPNRLASQQAERLAEKFGFAPARSASPMPGQYDLGHSMLMWGLARAFNPAATSRQVFQRERYEIWISRERVLAQYGPGTNVDAPG